MRNNILFSFIIDLHESQEQRSTRNDSFTNIPQFPTSTFVLGRKHFSETKEVSLSVKFFKNLFTCFSFRIENIIILKVFVFGNAFNADKLSIIFFFEHTFLDFQTRSMIPVFTNNTLYHFIIFEFWRTVWIWIRPIACTI